MRNTSDGTYFSNRNTFHHHWKVSGLDAARCEAIQGDYRESLLEPGLLARLGIDAAAVVHIDCDVYEAAKIALNFVAPVLQQGSVLLFDEFHANHASNATGERRALREMLERILPSRLSAGTTTRWKADHSWSIAASAIADQAIARPHAARHWHDRCIKSSHELTRPLCTPVSRRCL